MGNSDFYRVLGRTLPLRPGQALGALYWQLTGRKVRARNRLRIAAEQSPAAYPLWIETIERNDDMVATAETVAASWRTRPRYSVIADVHAAAGQSVEQLIGSITRQCYADWELLLRVSDDLPLACPSTDPRVRLIHTPVSTRGEWLGMALAAASGDYVVPLPEGALLPPTALFRYTAALQAVPDVNLLFGDHDRIDARGMRNLPWCKPGWNEEMLLAQDYVSPACAIRADAARAVLQTLPEVARATPYALILRLSLQSPARVTHVPHIQCHLPALARVDAAAHSHSVTDYIAEAAPGAVVRAAPFDTLHVSWPLPDSQPLVSIIVPTRDKVKLLRACISSLLDNTDYRPFELIVADNGSAEKDAVAYLEEITRHPQVRVLSYDHPYNFSAINNFAVGHARGEYLCLLNNDTEIVDATWLTEMMRQAVRPQVGAVGAKLLYGDGSIQHAGVVVGLGGAAGHAHRFQRNESPGYFRQAHVAQFVSAVTAACLVVRKDKYLSVGGLDEEGLQIAFNDVDFCLKLQRAGWRNVYSPAAVLIHHESKSRGKDVSPKHVERYRRELSVLQARWNTEAYGDPAHHPSLDRGSETFLLRL